MDHLTISTKLQQIARQKNKILNASIELLSACNCECIHCYHNEHYQNGLSFDQYVSIIDQLKDEGVFDIQLTGGEIFLRYDLVDIIDYIFKKHISIEIFTNATLINDSIAKKISKKIKTCYVSVYGYSKEVYESITRTSNSFDAFSKGVDILLKNNIPVQFNVVILKENYHEMFKMIEFCAKKLNCPKNDPRIRVSFNVLPQKNGCDQNVCHAISGNEYIEGINTLYFGKKPPSYDEIKACIPVLEVAPCRAGNWSVNISASGEVSPCMCFPLVFGNVLKSSLREILNNSTSRIHRKINISNIEGCNNCEYINFCSLCIGQIYTVSGSYKCDKKSDLCRQTKEFAEFLQQFKN